MEIKYIEPSVLHDEMLRLRKEKQMDFLECLSGMDWGIPDEKDAPDTPPRTRRSLSVGIYCYRRTDSGTHRHSKPGTSRTSFRQRYLESCGFQRARSLRLLRHRFHRSSGYAPTLSAQ